MLFSWQLFPGKAPLVALAVVLLMAATSCGKSVENASSYIAPPAVVVAEGNSISGKVTLTGGMPEKNGKTIDVGGNPFCTGHPALVDPTWQVAADGGLGNVVLTVRGGPRAENVLADAGMVDQKHCEFVPNTSAIQAGQSLRLHNSDLTFHNIRVVRHEVGTRDKGQNIDNLAQPAQGAENVRVFAEPGVYRLECDVHRWMRAWVFVNEGVHTAVSKADGTFAFSRTLADGDYTVEAWHPQFASPLTQKVHVQSGKGTADFAFSLDQSFDR